MHTKIDRHKTDLSKMFGGLTRRIRPSARAIINHAEKFDGPYETEVVFVLGNQREQTHMIKLMSADGQVIAASDYSEKNLEDMEKIVEELNL
jgi:hypothetical protein